jgi:tellurite resistance protein TehA-like permease
VPLHPGWWGFVFPMGAMTLAVSAVGAATGIGLLELLGLVATGALTMLWAFVGARTIGMLAHRRA